MGMSSEIFKMIRALGKAVDIHLPCKNGDVPITMYAYPVEEHLVVVLPCKDQETAEYFFNMLEDLRQLGPGAPVDRFLGLGDMGEFYKDESVEASDK